MKLQIVTGDPIYKEIHVFNWFNVLLEGSLR